MSQSPTEHLEHAEHAEHAAHSGNAFLTQVSVTIAILAVVAATVGSFETVESGRAIADKNGSVLFQNQATDSWSFFEAQSIKKNLYDLAGATATPDRQADLARKSQQYDKDGTAARARAEDLEKERDAALAESEAHEHRHHVLTAAVTLLHVSIAVATIAIITRGRRWPWYVSIALGAAGTILAGAAYL